MEGTRRAESRGAALLLGAFAVVAPQLLGGATGNTHLVITLGGGAVALFCAIAFRGSTRALGVAPLALLASTAAAGWTLLQVLPVPCSLVRWAQPERVTLDAALEKLGAIDSSMCSLSLAPGATWAALNLAVTVAALMASATVAVRAGHRRTLLTAIAISSVAMASVALAHAVVEAHSVFGLYTPIQARPQFLLAPLMNENHLAGHIALGFPLCLAFARSSTRLEGTTLWWTAAFVTFATGLLTLSRGGAVVLLLGGVGYLAVASSSQRPQKGQQARALAIAAALVCMVLGTWISIDLVAKQFTADEAPLRKLSLTLQLGELARAHPWVGAGRGALGDLSTRLVLRNQRMLFAENLPMQWIVEWGIPASLLFAVAFCGSLRKLRFEQRTEKALACGFLALVLQNFVDFSLELPGVACVAAIALGVLVAREEPDPRTSWLQEHVRMRQALWALAPASLVCTIVASPWLTRWSRVALQGAIADAIVTSRPESEVRPHLRKAFAGYPLDPMFLVLGAGLAVRDDTRDAPGWLNLAFEAAPGWAAPHLQAASYLERRGKLDQAAIELGLAVDLEPTWHRAPCEFIKRHPSPDLAWAIVPPGAPREQVRREEAADCLLQANRWAEADTALVPILERFPRSEYGLRRSVLTARNLGHPDLALSRAQEMLRRLPASPASFATLAEVLGDQGRPMEALRMIETAPLAVRNDQHVLLAEARAAARIADERRLEQAIGQLLARHGTTSQARAGFLKFASQQLTVVGNHLAALARAQAAYDLTGDPSALELAHEAAMRAGSLSVALRTAALLCNFGHRGQTFCAQSRSARGAHP